MRDKESAFNDETSTMKDPESFQQYLEMNDDEHKALLVGEADVNHIVVYLPQSNKIENDVKVKPDSVKEMGEEILVPNRLSPRVSGACFRFDCLSAPPGHSCCQPAVKSKEKRHLAHEQTDRSWDISSLPQFNSFVKEFNGETITATITRVEKSINQW